MIIDIKQKVDEFTNLIGKDLTPRNIAGINKIQYELDLLKEAEPKPKKKVSKAPSSTDD